MTGLQKIIKYCAIALAVFLIVNIFSGITKILAGFAILAGSSSAGDWQDYPVEGAISVLQIDVDAADLILSTADTWQVRSNHEHLTVKEQFGKLTIQEESSVFTPSNGLVVEISIPAELKLDRAVITAGAGRVRAERLEADDLQLKFGAGETVIGELIAGKTADIDAGAGKVVIEGGALRDLELNMGVGELKLTGALSGDCALDMAIGAADICVIGNLKDYQIDYAPGIGKATLNGSRLSDSGTYGFGEHELDISGGIGDIDISFKK